VNHPKNLRELIAANIRRLRSATPLEAEDIAKAASHFGLAWTPAWVAGVEKGAKALTAEQLIALPFVLTSALGHRVSLADLFLGEAAIHLGQQVEGTSISPSYLREMITAAPFRRPFLEFEMPETSETDNPVLQAAEKMREIQRANLGDVDIRAIKRAEDGAGDTEAKLAKKLGVAEIVVIAAAASLWGRSLTEERDALADVENANKTIKATITRKLANSITEKLAQAETAAQERALDDLRSHVANSNDTTALYPIVRQREPIPFTEDVTFTDEHHFPPGAFDDVETDAEPADDLDREKQSA
jgi:transcriptional regulator with XRE-family HTH domain